MSLSQTRSRALALPRAKTKLCVRQEGASEARQGSRPYVSLPTFAVSVGFSGSILGSGSPTSSACASVLSCSTSLKICRSVPRSSLPSSSIRSVCVGVPSR